MWHWAIKFTSLPFYLHERTPSPLIMTLVGPYSRYRQTFWRTEKILFRAAIRTPDRQVRSLITTPTTVPRLLKFYYPYLYFYFSCFSCGLLLFQWRKGPLRAQAASFLRFRDQIQLDTPHSVGLLWARDRAVVETSTWQHTTFTRDKRPRPWRDSNPQSQ
jgi:hypothetical protein